MNIPMYVYNTNINEIVPLLSSLQPDLENLHKLGRRHIFPETILRFSLGRLLWVSLRALERAF
jgi:hypothetical protein